jgi:hypothetical protein
MTYLWLDAFWIRFVVGSAVGWLFSFPRWLLRCGWLIAAVRGCAGWFADCAQFSVG